jgi:hypothetical protein
VHSTFAENRLDEDGRDGAVHRRSHRVGISPSDVSEPFRHRREGLVLGRLSSGRQGSECATVEAAEGADHGVATATSMLASELDRALDRLGPAVGEEHLAGPAGGACQQLVDRDGRSGRLRVGEEVADVEQLARLPCDRLGHCRVGVPQ